MSLQVVGAGVGRTGTHSLKEALEKVLGGRATTWLRCLPIPRKYRSGLTP
jgi:Sulfotransferase domain